MSKLIRIERTIAKYSINNEKIISEEIIAIPIETLISIVTPRDDDPELFGGYPLDENQLSEINDHLKNKLAFNFSVYYYVLECTGIYDNNLGD